MNTTLTPPAPTDPSSAPAGLHAVDEGRALPLALSDADASEITNHCQPSPFLVAFYLPQFHPIPENNAWWGEGFTEWTNVAKAKPLYKNHYQPHLPADLGFYDLRVPETREAQAALARSHGINAFCYYHYWFAGRRLLQKPLEEVLRLGQPDFPFMLCWANDTWTGVWYGAPDRILIEQTYPGENDHAAHFQHLLPVFRDKRYVKLRGKPVFCIWRATSIPKIREFTQQWEALAVESGFPGMHFIATRHGFNRLPLENLGLHAEIPLYMPPRRKTIISGRQYPTVYKYEDIYEKFLPGHPANGKTYPCVKPNWDNTPRSGADGLVFEGATPELFRKQFEKALDWSEGMPADNRVIFIKAWNEWAEGNCLEPEARYGRGFLTAIKDALAAHRMGK
jgi:hypothetical protein